MTQWARHSKWIGAGVLAIAATSVSAEQITLYEGQDFQGRHVATNDAIAIVASPGFANAASSIVVAEGVWEACTDAYFRGRCVELLPGNYPHANVDLIGRIASVRQVADAGGSTPIVINAQPVVVNPVPVVINPLQIVTNPAPVVVIPAPVAASAQPTVINPAPASINALPPVIVNAQPVVIAAPQVVPVAPSQTGRMVLYEYPNFGGARAIIDRGQAKDLDWTNFAYGHRATSIRVESGTWMVCSGMSFQGECRILEPGEYPRLLGPLVAGISSAQQVWRPEYGAVNVYSR